MPKMCAPGDESWNAKSGTNSTKPSSGVSSGTAVSPGGPGEMAGSKKRKPQKI